MGRATEAVALQLGRDRSRTWRRFENTVTVGVLVEIVCDLCLFEPQIPVRD